MAELKTKPTGAKVADFIAGVADPQRRKDCDTIVQLMQEVTGQPPEMWGESIVGFGRLAYSYASGRTGEWMATGFSPRKENLTLYIMSGFDEHAELMGRLGKYKTGKGCLYIKRLSDVDLGVLRELVARSVAKPA